MSKGIIFRNHQNEKIYPCPYFPIGSIYMSLSNTNPSTYFGGTWEQIKDRFLLGAGNTYTAGSTGGEATHKLTQAELPHLYGSFQSRQAGGMNILDVYSGGNVFTFVNNGGSRWQNQVSSLSSASNNNALIKYDNGGKDTAHNNMPPYYVVYIWRRTA